MDVSLDHRTWGELPPLEVESKVGLARRYLNPGDLAITQEPRELFTILGSCVAVCLWDTRLRYAGMNHFLLPRAGAMPARPERFGNTAMRALLDGMLGAGCRRGDFVAKVFGGASLQPDRPNSANIGNQNAACAEGFLMREGIMIAGGDTGGDRGRKVSFRSDTGDVLLWRI